MSLQLNLNPADEARLLDAAVQFGTTPEALASKLVSEHLPAVEGDHELPGFVEIQYSLVNPPRVRHFLQRHPDIVPLLNGAVEPLEAIFGPGNPITLAVVSDQEADPTLAVRIQTSGSVDRIRACRKRFYQEYWMVAVMDGDLPVSFNVNAD